MDDNENKVKQENKESKKHALQKYVARMEIEEELTDNDQTTKRVFIGLIVMIAFFTLCYMLYHPLPIYEEVEYNVNHYEFSTVDKGIVNDPDYLSQKHQELIVKTQDFYKQRRDEIVEEIKNGPITEAAIAKCTAQVATGDYGPTAKMGSFEWNIPESREQMDLGISAAEADQLLYYYSCLYDMNFFNGDPANYEEWLMGIEGTSKMYPVEAFGNVYYLPGRGGYYLPPDELADARTEAMQAGRDAVKDAKLETLSAQSPLVRVFSFLVRPFIRVAEADEGSEVYQNAARAAMEAAYAANGSSLMDQVIYTGISDQLEGQITFTISSEPADCWPTGTNALVLIEEYDLNDELKDIVAETNSMPFAGRIHVDTYEIQGTKTEAMGDCNPLGVAYTLFLEYINLQKFECEEMVDFVGRININASGIPDQVRSLIDYAYGEKGNMNKYRYTDVDEAWCADYVSTVFEHVGLTKDDYFRKVAGVTNIREEFTATTTLHWANGDKTPINVDSSPMSSIAQWGGDGYTVKPADMVVWGGDKHVGVVIATSPFSITVAQGNASDMVQVTEYAMDDGLGLADGVVVHSSDLFSGYEYQAMNQY